MVLQQLTDKLMGLIRPKKNAASTPLTCQALVYEGGNGVGGIVPMAAEDLQQAGGSHFSRLGESRPMEANDRPQAKVGDTELHEGSNGEQASVWSQLEVGGTYQRQLDLIRQVAV